MKTLRQISAIILLCGNVAGTQAEVFTETDNSCDTQIRESNPLTARCKRAVPPLDSADCLASADFCINQRSFTTPLIVYPGRAQVLDNSNNVVLVRGEAFAVTALVFAKDKLELEELVRSMQIQASIGGEWIRKRYLSPTEFGELSNLRHYYFLDCDQARGQFWRDWDFANKVNALVNGAGPGPHMAPDDPRPAPESLLGTIPLDPTPSTGNLPSAPGADERFLQEWARRANEKAAGNNFVPPSSSGSECPDKTLPYYWTTISFQYSPELGETRLRLYTESPIKGRKSYPFPETNFKVYRVAASGFDMPAKNGNRDFSFQIFASSDSGDILAASVVYNENTLSATHRTAANIDSTASEKTINGRSIKRTTARGRFPFKKDYWDDVALADVSQTAFQARDETPIAIKSGATVAYRMEVGASAESMQALLFASNAGILTMPAPLTFALLGDSFAAGQGAPFFSQSEGPWLNDDCHRSRHSGQYRALNQFIKESNKACDYIFAACEGATMQDLYLQKQRVNHNPDGTTYGELKQQRTQIGLVKKWMDDKHYAHLDAALFSIGGNNVGFAGSITAAITGAVLIDAWFTGTDDADMREVVDEGFTRINGSGTGSYRELHEALKRELQVQEVIICGYPDVTHDSTGSVCDTDCSETLPGSTSVNLIPHTISATELEYGNTIMTRLTDAASSAGALPTWHYANIFDASRNHGICVCDEPYFTTWAVAVDSGYPIAFACNEGKGAVHLPAGASCSFHPNPLGYEQYITPIKEQLQLLYGN